ncbi:MAG: hydroxymethylbilane synthase, partial [Oscillospiraceae bacterium]|nr:hydroxymethylbilane synthase [Oscillospiraceae bacterium]
MKLIIGSRASRLAVIQSQLVMDAISGAHPDIEPELLTLKTTGDRILDRPLDKIGGKGLFVRELDAALREGRADLAVHSCKDLPADIPADLPLCAFTRREDPRDALVLPAGKDRLDGPIGCSSLRRRLQLEALFPGVPTIPVRGNVLTRLEELDNGEFGALVLAAAGLRRLGLEGR